MTKVLFLHHGGNPIRGSEMYILNLLAGLDRRRFEPLVVCDEEVFAREVQRRAGITPFRQKLPQIMMDGNERRFEIATWVVAVYRIARIIRKHRIALLYCNNGRPMQAAYYAARLTGVPIICHVHCPYEKRYVYLYRLYRADKMIFPSKAVEAHITGRKKFRKPFETVYYGLDLVRFAPAEQRDSRLRLSLGIPADAVVIGQVGSLIERKGVDVLLRAFARLYGEEKNAYLVLVGSGVDEPRFRSLAQSLGVMDRLRFAGEHSVADDFYKHLIDINVLCSRNDALPYSLLEGAACGLPCVGSNVDGIPEEIIDGHSGHLFPREDPEALANRLLLLLRSAELRKSFGINGRKMMESRFSMENNLQRIQEIMEDLAVKPGAGAGSGSQG
jgi:hypothetical protein